MTRNANSHASPRRRGGQSRQRGANYRPNSRRAGSSERPPQAPQGFFQKLLSWIGLGGSKGSRPAPARDNAPAPSRSPAPRPAARPPRRPDPAEVTSGRLHVGNLSYDATESDLLDLFSGLGQVKMAEVVYHRHNQRSKGFAFVEMQTTEEARRAVEELHDKEFMGRKLSVSGARSAGDFVRREREDDDSEEARSPEDSSPAQAPR